MATSDSIGSGGHSVEVRLDGDNTFQFMPGPMDGVACPCCFRDQLLREVIASGRCTACGAELELALRATPAG
ncbi:hypothetical protein [Halomarina litorea]|uniref:hypothetical protein n=1 Tax=Halomarina litorea TaxID=2961595 RepID=UPI0020C50070|nr:hypothetical protein [Halomarina sp. BCD28]